jgi:menaquinone-9 beta-reductase
MNQETVYDCAIIGGGVAGLSLAILLAKDGKKVILFEKENYPFHKVCGEYISNESVKFINKLGVDLSNYNLPRMDSLFLSSISGIAIKRNLSVGGVGFSRYELDNLLYQTAIVGGVEVRTKTKVQSVQFEKDQFQILFNDRQITAKTVCGAYGKNSNIDAQLNRMIRADGEKNLFVAVKHHIKADFYDRTRVEMHNFNGGYCGMSSIENGKVNLSYITKASNLRKCGGKISELEKRVLSENPFLKRYFDKAKFELEKPLVISHLHFGLKTAVDSHILMLGDAAGNIAPLSGNGMSMAFRSASIAHEVVNAFLNNQITRTAMETAFTNEYKKAFSARISYARMIHKTFGKPFFNNLSFYLLKMFPFMIDFTQTKIHGREF